MKIIASAGRDKYLLEASDTEIYNLLGFGSKYDKEAPVIVLGMGIKLHAMYNKIQELKAQEGKIRVTFQSLIGIANLLLPLDDQVNGIVRQATIKDETST